MKNQENLQHHQGQDSVHSDAAEAGDSGVSVGNSVGVIGRDDVDVLLHELKQPLFSAEIVSERLVAHAEKLIKIEPSAGEPLLRDVQVLLTSLQQFKEIIDTYVAIDKVECVRQGWLERFVRQIDALEIVFESNNIDFSFESSVLEREDGPDLGAVGHILRNLVTNAMLAARENACLRKGHVLVQLSATENALVLCVHDSGAGLKPEARSRIFQRGASTRLGSGGSGFGLWVCRKLATALNGTIDYSNSSIVGGACFTVIFPLESNAKRFDSVA